MHDLNDPVWVVFSASSIAENSAFQKTRLRHLRHLLAFFASGGHCPDSAGAEEEQAGRKVRPRGAFDSSHFRTFEAINPMMFAPRPAYRA